MRIVEFLDFLLIPLPAHLDTALTSEIHLHKVVVVNPHWKTHDTHDI